MRSFKNKTIYLISILFILSVFSCNCNIAKAEYSKDIIVTGTDAIWTDSRAYTSLSDTVSAIGVNNQTIYVKKREPITSDLSVPKNINLVVLPGGLLDISLGKVLTIGSYKAGHYQTFDGDGRVKFGPGAVENIYPQWWKTYHDGIHCDGLAIDKAITACMSSGGHIVLTPGDWYWISTVPEIHEEIPDMLIISGYGATINLCNAAPTAFNLSSLSGNQFKYIQNIILEGFTVDAHDSGVWGPGGGSMVGCIVTSAYVAPTYFYPTNTSFRNITIKDIIAKNVLETSHDVSVHGMMGIGIGLQPTSASTEILDILIDNVEVEGGRCAVSISRQGIDPTNTNTWLDNISVNNVHHVISQEKSGYYISANVHLCGGGRCGNVIVSNCYGKNSGDVGIEVDCAENLIIKNTTIDNCRNAPFFITNYAEPPNLEAQTTLIEGCTARYIDSTWPITGPGYKFHAHVGASDIRQATLRDCKYAHNGRSFVVSYGQYVQGCVEKLLTIDGFVVEDVCNFNGDYSTQPSLVGFDLRSDIAYISNVSANVVFTNLSGTAMDYELFRERNVGQLTINNVDFDLTVSENPGLLSNVYLVRFGFIGAPSDEFGGGSMKNVDVDINAGIDFYPVDTVSTGDVTAKFVVENCDFNEVTDFADLVSFEPAAANVNNFYTNLRFRQNDYPATEAIYKTYALINGVKTIINDTFRKGHWFPDTTKITGIEESYDHGGAYITTDINKTTLSEGTWAKITSNAIHNINFYFADD